MAIYENLPVFKQSYDLLLEIYEMSRNMTRDYRYTIGEELKKRMMELMVCVYKANSSVNMEKVAHIQKARECVVEIKLYNRLLHDLKQISVKRLAALTIKIESISKQLTAWARSIK